jgi:hypothetical protein
MTLPASRKIDAVPIIRQYTGHVTRQHRVSHPSPGLPQVPNYGDYEDNLIVNAWIHALNSFQKALWDNPPVQ